MFILIVFFKTETLFSKNDWFNVNNIQIEKNNKITNKAISDLAIKKGFYQLTSNILLKKDSDKLSDLNFETIKQLVTYYQITNILNKENNIELLNFNITFDKNKIHDLFYKKGILYSEVTNNELYVLPVLIRNNEVFIFNKNYFYENWNKFHKDDLIEFILPLENIEIIRTINNNKNNLVNLNITKLFQDFSNKNLAFIIIEDDKSNEKIYVKTIIEQKKISKSLELQIKNQDKLKFYDEIITETKKELTNLVKSTNLIDIRTPSFLNIKLVFNKKNNLVEFNSKIKNIKSIENIYVQEFNKNYMNIRIKYLGKLDKLTSELKKENINLELINDQWFIKNF
jgi:hypothetical protein